MKRRFLAFGLSIWLALCPVFAQEGKPVGPNNLVTKIGQSTLPMVLVSSGTMGNNGALSGITAVPTAYPNAYCSVPAGAIATGVPAAQTWYYCTFSDTTHATLFNNTYASCPTATPCIPASPTAFSTTGPGAYTQTTGSNIAAYTLAIAGNTIGLNGGIEAVVTKSNSNSAGAKTISLNYSTFAFATTSGAFVPGGGAFAGFVNRGVANVQLSNLGAAFVQNGNTGTVAYGAIDSTQSNNLVVNLQLATATDFIVLEGVVVKLSPSVP